MKRHANRCRDEEFAGAGAVKSSDPSADVDDMAVVAALLFCALVGLALVLAGAGVYYLRVLKPRLDAVPDEPPANVEERDALATFVEQLQELARLRDQGLLTSREFTSKKSELLERI
jgi:Short C-terminal domain